MPTDIAAELSRALARDFGFKTKGKWLQQGKCPDCDKREVFVHADNPRVLKCGRLDRCGWERSVKEFYPEIFDDWSKRYKADAVRPAAAADAYLLHGRGLDLQGLGGAYTQEYYRDADRNIGSATVRFPLPGDGWWERLIDQPGRFDKKARFKWGASYAGQWWTAPGDSVDRLAKADEIWIEEGIFDALALRQSFRVLANAGKDRAAVSAMTVGNYPEQALAELRKAVARSATPDRSPKLVFAFDVGRAGVDFTRKWIARARLEGWKATAAQVRPDGEGNKLDWNDLLVRDKLGETDLTDYLWNGEVTIAASPSEKATLIYDKFEWSSFALVHGSKTWWASFDEAKIMKIMEDEALSPAAAARQACAVREIANCTFRILYRERDEALDETNYYMRVDFPGKTPSAKGRFSSGSLTASAEFKKRLFAFSGMFTGSTNQLDRLMNAQTRELKTVEPIDFTGYSRDHGAWVFGELAVKGGRVHRRNDEDYFELGRASVKLRTSERILSIDYDPDAVDLAWYRDVVDAFGVRGVVTTAYWLLSFFAEQIRAHARSLGFLEMAGIPGTGKSTLIVLLWTLVGRDNYEGFDPAKATAANVSRNFAKVGNLPVVLMEGDRDQENPHARRFDWDELKPLYNGRGLRGRGVRNGGNETYEPPFRGAVVIEQNLPVNASKAVLERIMHLTFDKSGWGPSTKAAADRIEAWPVERGSGFIVHVVKREAELMDLFAEATKRHERAIVAATAVSNFRLVKNHAQLAAGVDMLRRVTPMSEGEHRQAIEFVYRMCGERQIAVSSDHPVVEKFWETFDYLVELENESTDRPLNSSRTPEARIAVNLLHFEERCRARGIVSINQDELRRHLKASKSRRFVAQKTVNSPSGKTVHCWVFDREPDFARSRTLDPWETDE